MSMDNTWESDLNAQLVQFVEDQRLCDERLAPLLVRGPMVTTVAQMLRAGRVPPDEIRRVHDLIAATPAGPPALPSLRWDLLAEAVRSEVPE